jgi:hypothetical protein
LLSPQQLAAHEVFISLTSHSRPLTSLKQTLTAIEMSAQFGDVW